MTRVHNIEKKLWYNTTISLLELKRQIDAALAKVDDPATTKVVIVTQPHYPLEAPLLGVNLRSQVLDHLQGEHFNRLSGDLTEIEMTESAEEVTAQLQQGDVFYLVAGGSSDFGHPMSYMDLSSDGVQVEE